MENLNYFIPLEKAPILLNVTWQMRRKTNAKSLVEISFKTLWKTNEILYHFLIGESLKEGIRQRSENIFNIRLVTSLIEYWFIFNWTNQ